MNLYFSPTERNELNFPTSNLSTIITNSIINKAELEKINPDIDENLNKEDIEISELYKKYKSKQTLLSKTKSQKKLNKVKVFFIVKSKIVNGKEVRYALPIRNFDDLGNSLVEKINSFVASIFYLEIDDNPSKLNYIQGNPVSYPFRLDQIIDPETPFSTKQEFPLENLIIPKKYVVHRGEIKSAKEPKFNNQGKMVSEESIYHFEAMRSFFDFLSEYEYEYNESMIDNTFLVNSSGYSTDIRKKNSFNREKEDNGFLTRLKALNVKNTHLELFNRSKVYSLIFGNKDAAVDKNIIPVFSNLEDAQELLITVLDELHQPFQIRRKVENFNTTKHSKNYLDDSFSFQNNYFFTGPKSKLQGAQDLLMKYGVIKVSDLSKSTNGEFYHENKYQTKGPFFLKESYGSMPEETRFASKFIWREIDYFSILDEYFPNQPEAYSWGESRAMTKTDKVLLKESQDIKIISMGLGDFLEFWNNPTTKNAEVLFIPSSDDLNDPLLPKNSRDKFYDYQQKFRHSNQQEIENYIYEIKLSTE